jgi:hypothetical protein
MTALAVLGKHSFYRHFVVCGGVVALLVIARRPEVVDEVLAAAQAAE